MWPARARVRRVGRTTPIEAPMNSGSYYNDKVVRSFAIMTVVW